MKKGQKILNLFVLLVSGFLIILGAIFLTRTTYGSGNGDYIAVLTGDDLGRNVFRYNSITISDGNNSFTIMDRNLGARKPWDGTTWEDNPNNYSGVNDYYGYYYQWGNNYGFSDKTTISSGNIINQQINNATENSTYSSPNWDRKQPWSIQNNLWGEETNTSEARQGPCPDGWHVPSSDEWAQIRSIWCISKGYTEECVAGSEFAQDLLLPPTGWRGYSSLLFNSRGVNGKYWSSSNTGSKYSQFAYFYDLYIDPNSADARSIGLPVRCIQDIQEVAKKEKSSAPMRGAKGVNSKDIVIEADLRRNSDVTIYKYFSNDYTVDWGDGSPIESVTSDIEHMYYTAGIYNITLSLSGSNRWTFGGVDSNLVYCGKAGSHLRISYMPSLADAFGDSATAPGNYFFYKFNHIGSLESFPEGSFDTSHITTAGSLFFDAFNSNGALTSLPEGSFDLSNITTAQSFFFTDFNRNGHITTLPDSFKLSSAGVSSSAGYREAFNSPSYTLNKNVSDLVADIDAPLDDRNTFSDNQPGRCGVNANWLVNAPSANDCRMIVIEATATAANQNLTINKHFANEYTVNWGDGTPTQLLNNQIRHTYSAAGTYYIVLSLSGSNRWTFTNTNNCLVPSGSPATTVSNIKIIYMPSLADAFGSSATAPGNSFFRNFNYKGAITSLPEGSFDTSNITTVGTDFFAGFNYQGAITSLPAGSFRFATGLTTVSAGFFSAFNVAGLLTSLPEGSFDLSKITTATNNFLYDFNYQGHITTLPDSFKLSSAGAAAYQGYRNAFNSPSYTINKNVSDLVAGLGNPSSDMNTFSDNQPGRCGVHANWLVNAATCYTLSFNATENGGTTSQSPIANLESGTVVTLPTCTATKTGYNCVGWNTNKNATVGLSTVTVRGNTTVYAIFQDNIKPTVALSNVSSTLKTRNQTITMTCTDSGSKLVGYYGPSTTAATGGSVYTTISPATGSFTSGMTMTSYGTYYFLCKDTAGNTGQATQVMRYYRAYSYLNNTTGSAGTYNTGNYSLAATAGRYTIPNNTVLTLSDIYTVPTCSTYKGWSTIASPSSLNTITTGKVSSNTNWYVWFDRNSYALTLTKGNGVTSVSGAGTYKYGSGVSISATCNTASGYAFSGWTKTTGTTPTNFTATSQSQTVNMACGTVTLRADCKDATAPVCKWGTPSKTNLKAGATGHIVLTCTDAIGVTTTALNSGDITLSNAYVTLSNATTGGTANSRTFTFIYTAKDAVNGTVKFTLPANKVKDAAGNAAATTGSASNLLVDTTPPVFSSWSYISGSSVYVSGANHYVKPGGSIVFSVTHTDNNKLTIQYFRFYKSSTGDIRSYINNGTFSDWGTYVDDNQINIVSATCSDSDGSCTDDDVTYKWYSTIGANAVDSTYQVQTRGYDIAGNITGFYRLGSSSLIIDGTAPNCTWGTPSKTNLKSGATGHIVLTCTDSGAGVNSTALTTGNVTLSAANLTVESVTAGGSAASKTYTIVYKAKASVNGTTTFTVGAGKISDNVGNTNAATAASSAVRVDNIAPSCVISAQPTKTLLMAGQTGSVAFTCTSTGSAISTTSLTGGALTLSNAYVTVDNAVVTDTTNGKIYTFKYTAKSNVNGTLTFKLTAGKVADAAGNTNAVSSATNSIRVDTTVPVCTWGTPSNTNMKAGTTGHIVLTCTDAVSVATSTLNSGDITYSTSLFTLSNATVAGPTTGRTYTFIYTAKQNVSGTGTFTLPANKVKDTAGNAAATKTSAVVTVDSVVPTAYVQYTYYVSGTLATLTGFNKGGITITNNGGSNTMRFPYTGSNFRGTFQYRDTIGNTNSTAVWGWNNEWYITTGFWTNNPTTGEIVNAIYGDGNGNTDRTAYTKLWTGVTCATGSMKIVYVNPGFNTIPNQLAANTIYVLNGGTYTKNATLYLHNCSTLIGKTDDVVLYSTARLDHQVRSDAKNSVVIDNIKVNGTRVNQYSTGTQHAPNSYGMFMYNNQNNTTINRVESYESLYGLLVQYASNTVIENSQFYDNENYGLYLYPRAANIGVTVNNVQIYGNKSHGLFTMSATAGGIDTKVSINNTQIYNNGSYGIYNRRNSNIILNNIEVYNNSSYGIYVYECSGTAINNAKIYNNGSYAVYSESNGLGTRYYGTLQYFGNGQAAVTNARARLATGSASDYSSIGFTAGTLSNAGTMSCALVTVNNHFVQNVSDSCNTRSYSWTTKLDRQPSRYVYGNSQKKQAQPVAYVNGTLAEYDTTGYNYNTTKYLGEVNPVSLIGIISMPNDVRYSESQTVTLTLRTNITSATYTITGDVTTVNGTMGAYSKTQNVTLSAGNGYKNIYVTYTANGQTATDHIIVDYISISNSIINKYYGTGSDYIRTWEGNTVCDPSKMSVVTLNPGDTIPSPLVQDTIYVLNQGNYIIPSYRYFAGNCTALIGSGDVTIYGSYNPGSSAASSGMFYMSNVRNNIIDNVKLDGTNNGAGGTHTPLFYGIWIYNLSRYNVINNVQAFNMSSYGLYVSSAVRELLVNKSQFFNNGVDGIYVTSSYFNTFNNVQCFNNTRAGIAGHSSAHSLITDSQFYNNGQYGVYISASSLQRISDIKVYNNGVAGIYFKGTLNSSYPRYFNNVWIFNNPSATVTEGTVNTNRYYGTLKVFGNDNNTLAGGFVNTDTSMNGYGWTSGVLSSTGDMGCDIVANPRNSAGVYLLTGNLCDRRGNITGWTSTYITGIMYGANQIKQSQPIRATVAGTVKLYGTQTFDYDTSKPVAYAYPIANAAPTVTLTNNGPKNESNTITWTATGSDTEDSASLLKYSFHSGSCNGTVLQEKSSTKTYSKMLDEPGQMVVYVVVYDNLGATGCKASTGVWRNVAPTSVTITRNPTSTGECRPITFTASAVDTGSSTISYQWYTNSACTTAINGATSQTYTHTLNNSGTYSVYVKATDSQGSGICSAVNTASWTNVAPTANNFSTGNIGKTTRSITLAQFIAASSAKEGDCGAGNLTFSAVRTNGSKGNCEITGSTLKYTPSSNKTGTDTCVITIKDNENSTKDVTVTFNDIDTSAPNCTWGTPSKTNIKANATGHIVLTCTDAGAGVTTTSLATGDIIRSAANLEIVSVTAGGTAASKTYTVVYKGISGKNGGVTLTVTGGKVADGAGNTNAKTAASSTITVDTIAPSCVISTQPTKVFLAAGQTGTVAFTCTSTGSAISTASLAASALTYTTSVVTLGNATVTNATNGKVYTFTYTANADGMTTFKLAAGKVSDEAGNTNAVTSDTNTVVVDFTDPTLVFTGVTPANNVWQSGNNFTGQIDITEANLKTFNRSFNGITSGTESKFDSGLVLYYKFDKNQADGETDTLVKDLSNHGNDGTVNGATWTSGGKVNGAYSFDGTDDYIQLPNDLGYSNNVSTFAWFKSNGTPKGGYHMVFGGAQRELSIPAAGQLRAGLYVNGERSVANHGAGLTDGNWHLVGMTYDGSTKKVYIDGALVGTVSIAGTLTTSFNRTIGRYGTRTDYYTNGQIDEARIYNRTLSEAEVLDYYNSTKGQYGVYDDSLVLMYNFDNVSALGESATLVKDLSNHGNDGTINGATYTSAGKRNGAYSFDGTNDYISINSPEINTIFGTSTNFTASARAKPAANGSTAILIESNGAYRSNASFGIWWYGGKYYCNLGTHVSGNGANTNVSISYTPSALNVWEHISCVIDGNIMKMYVDGDQKGSVNIASLNTRTVGDGLVYIGNRSSNYFNGQIDEVRIYNRALSSAEIDALYHSNLSKTAANKWTYTIGYTGLADGTYVYGGSATDMVGKSASISRTLNIDATAPIKPTYTAVHQDGTAYTIGSWTNKRVDFTVYTTEKNTVSNIQYSPNGTSSWNNLSFPVSALSRSGMSWSGTDYWNLNERNQTYYFRAIDSLGNISTVSDGYAIKYDLTNPVVGLTNSSTEWKKANISIKLTASDTPSGLSGGKAKYYWTGVANATLAQCWANGTQYTSGTTITGSTEGTRYLYVCAYDLAGNSKIASGTYKLDKTAPIVGLTNSSTEWKKADISIKLTASDTPSGLSGTKAKYYWTGVANATLAQCWANGTQYTSGTIITGSTEGIRYLYVCAYDLAGNSKVLSGTYKLDKTKPTGSLTTTSTLKSATQRLTGTCEDAKGVTAVYLGSKSSPAASDYKTITSTTSYTTGMNISAAGTYYLFCKDAAENVSDSKNKVYYSYTVYNMEENTTGTTASYNTNNYAQKSTGTYIAPSGTSITLASVYTNPSSSCDTFVGVSTGVPSTTTASVSTTAPTLNANSSYGMWFKRNTYTLTLTAGTGTQSPTGAGTYKWGSGIAINTTVKTGYTWSTWTKTAGVNPSTFTAGTKSQTIKLACSDVTLRSDATINSYTLTINPNGGKYNGTTSNTTVTQNYNTQYTMLYPTKTGYTFAGWQGDTSVNWTPSTVSVYNNKGNGTVTHSRVADATSPTNSEVLKVVTSGAATPGAGGLYQGVTAQQNHVYYQVYRAKIPVGYTLTWAGNSIGSGSSHPALTSMTGAGDWKTYVFRTNAGSGGSFSTFGHIYLNGSDNTNVTWYVASAQIYDATAGVVKTDFQQKYNFTTATNQTLTAQWTPNTYYIAYNANGGAGSMSSTTCTYGSNCALRSNSFTKTGYTFKGWSTSSSATSATYTNGQNVSNLTATNGNTVTLYAVWTGNTYTVEYYLDNTNKGSSTHRYGVSSALKSWSSLGASKTGYTFYGWSTSNGNLTRTYTDGQNVSTLTATSEGVVKLYAIMQQSVTFYSSTGKATTKTATGYNNNGTCNVKVPEAPTAINNYTALGWRDDTTAGDKEYAAAVDTNIANCANKYYAVYSGAATFYHGQAKTTTTTVTQYYNTNGAYKLTSPSSLTAINGWTALGWRDDTTAGAKEYGTGVSVTASSRTYYGVYSRTVSIVYSGGAGSVGSTSSTNTGQWYNTTGTITTPSFTLANNGFTKVGYTFVKWDLGNAGSTYNSWTPAVGASASKTAVAQWTPNTNTPYTVNYYTHNLGATTYTLHSTKGYSGTTDSTISVSNYVKAITGHTFEAGYANTGSTSKPANGAVTSTTILPDGSRVINMYYRPNYLFVQYDMNGGYLGAHGSTYSTNGSLITNTSNTLSGSTRFLRGLYGGKVGDVTISTFTSNGASGLHNYNNSNAINVLRTGYIVTAGSEWNTQTNGGGTSYNQDTTTYTATGFAGTSLNNGDTTVTVYVNWKPQIYTITYNLNGGTNNASNPSGYTIESGAITLQAPSRVGYTFKGWTGSNGTTAQTSVTIAAGSIGNKTYNAVWQANTYKISYSMDGGTNCSPAPTTATYDVIFTGCNNPTKTGYTFAGWKITGMGVAGVAHTYGTQTTTSATINSTTATTFKNLHSTSGSTVTFTALWTINSYTLTINPNGGVYNGTTSNTVVTQNYNTQYTMLYPTKTGYTFTNWQSDTPVDWSRLTGPSVYNNKSNGTVVHSRVEDATSPTNSKVLKVVTSGEASPGAGGFVQSVTSQANHVYYQVYRAKIPAGYTLVRTANANGSGRTMQYLTSRAGTSDWATYVIKMTAGSTGTFRDFGYIYLTGSNHSSVTWYVASAQIYDVTSGVVKADFQNKYNFTTATNQTLTAQWTPNTYYIAYNANGGAGSMSSTTCTYGSNCALRSNSFTKTGYTFKGWSTSSTATSATYTNGQNVSNLTATNGNTVTLYAIWADETAPSFSVSGTGVNESQPLTISITASDNGTGLDSKPYKCGSEDWKATASCSMGTENEPTSGTITIQVRDKVGNVASKSIRYEWKNVAPVKVSISNNGPKNEGTAITYTATAVDTGATLSYQWYSGANCSTAISSATGSTYNKTLNDGGSFVVSVKVTDSQGSGTCSGVSTGVWNNVKPTGYITNNGAKNECSEITYTFSGSDTGGGSLTYAIYEGTSCAGSALLTTGMTAGTNKTWTKTLNNTGTYAISLLVTDGNGATGICVSSIASWIDVLLTGHGFEGHASVGKEVRTVNWKTLSAASAGSCEPIIASVKTDGSKGSCSISSNNITYTPNTNKTGDDSCVITITDGDTSKDITVVWKNIDTTKPVGTLTSSSKTNSTSQRLTGTCTDSVGVTAIYFGTSSSPASGDYKIITSTASYITGMNVTESGTYYLFCKDAAGNISTGKSVTYVKYQVKNMLDKVSGAQGTYNTTNYDVNTTKPTSNTYYVILSGTNLTLSGLCTAPSGVSSSRVITSIGVPSTTVATSAMTVTAANTTYACWYNRTLYTLTGKINTGINKISYKINGMSSYSNISTTSGLNVKAGSDVSIFAVATDCYTYTATSEGNPQTWTNVSGNLMFSPTATANTNTITYNLNGGINNANNPSSYTIESGTITLQAPTKTGFTFKGWTGSNGITPQTSVSIAAGSCGNKTYNAVWQENTNTPYVVNYYTHNLGSTAYTLNSTKMYSGTTNATITLSDFAKFITGHTYQEGFAITTGSTTKPTDGAVTTTTILPDGSRVVNLYYRPNYLYVQYDMNGGYLGAHGTNYGTSGDLVTYGGSTLYLRGLYGGYVGNVTLDTFTSNGQSGLHNYNNSSAINVLRTGYYVVTGSEWNSKANGQGISYNHATTTYTANGFAGTSLTTGDRVVTVYVNWKPVVYTITYNMNGGTNNVNNPSKYTIESGAIMLQQPTRTGYTFKGWTGSNGTTAQANVSIVAGSYGNKTYNAVWQANTNTQYMVYHYVKVVGESEYLLSKTEILSGTTDETLLLSSLAKGSEFLCAHYSSGSLTGTKFSPGEIVTQTTINGDGSTKIYLYYIRNTRTVTLSGDEHIQALEGDGTVWECGSEVPVNAVPKPGYHFVRWEEKEEEEEEKIGEG